ncbi:MAG: Gfo/Idh/MocA family oxidoreductase [Planctomycetota bacterium]|jgi:predicted dehydrogenase|nr:Gfo/Idh/MocA family oxidoreductase [Planctomycetota bacterium]MDP7248126.1 Gfo/Idh/MocA family oxidoreductase [Planctomycetota bacterium]
MKANSAMPDDLHFVERKPVRIGVVGCGVVADYGHLPTIHSLAETELVGVADPDAERLSVQVEKYGVPGFESFEAMLGAVEMDAVALPVHPCLKLELIRVAAANGLHAFCEKPLTETVDEAEELVRMMDEAGLFVGVSFGYRGKQVVQRMMALLQDGAIGRLRAVHIVNLWDYHGLRSIKKSGNRRRRSLENLGTLDCGVHHLDLARWFADSEYSTLHAVGTSVEADNKMPDHIVFQARMENGVLVSINESGVWGHTAAERPPYEMSYHLLGENGFMTDRQGELSIVSGEKQWTEKLAEDKAWEDCYRQFVQVICGEEIPNRFLADGNDALINMQVAEEILRQCGDG